MVYSEEEQVSRCKKGMTFTEISKFFAKRTNFDDPFYGVVTSYAMQKYATKSFQPNLKKLSRDNLGNEIIKSYLDLKEDFKNTFANLDGGLLVSCDLWKSFNGEDHYLCVICHWVREDSAFKNNVIGFELLYPFDDYAKIASKIIEVLDKYNLKDKIHGISFEDGISKEKCMEHLVKEFNPVVPELFYLDRTFVNVVDLCAQQIVDQLGSFIDPVRELSKWARCCVKEQEFITLCKYRTPPLCRSGFSKDWKTTFSNLSTVYGCKEVLTKVYNECGNRWSLVDPQWDAINSVINLLWKFDDFTEDRFSYDSSCHMVIKDCIVFAHTLRSYESDPHIGSVVRNIRDKWLELFPEIPTVYCLATILDPRIKVEGLRQLLSYYYETMGVKYDVDEKVAHCMNVLKHLLVHHAPPCEPETNLGVDENKSSSSLEFNVIRDVLKRKRKREDDQEKKGDVGNYLSYEFEVSDDFELLEWWAKRREYFPVLSKVAKDVLGTPLSTTIPNRRYCPSKRVLDAKRSMLPPGLLRVSICKTDWDLSRKTMQEATGFDWDYRYDADFDEDD